MSEFGIPTVDEIREQIPFVASAIKEGFPTVEQIQETLQKASEYFRRREVNN